MKETISFTEWQDAATMLSRELGNEYIVSPLVISEIFNNIELKDKLEQEVKDEQELISILNEVAENLQKKNNTNFEASQTSNTILKNGLKEFWSWMEKGFKIVSPEKYKSRLNICKNCPYYQIKSNKIIYKLINLNSEFSPICSKCGCTIEKKAKMAHLSCPIENPQNIGFTLWGDPMRK